MNLEFKEDFDTFINKNGYGQQKHLILSIFKGIEMQQETVTKSF